MRQRKLIIKTGSKDKKNTTATGLLEQDQHQGRASVFPFQSSWPTTVKIDGS